jgi:lycopene beta-cyclase
VRDYDAIIAGGGLAGLSLAAHLAAYGWGDRQVLVVDDGRPSAGAWGFWSSDAGLLDAAVSRSYDRVRVHAGGTDAVLPLQPYRYHVVRRADLSIVVRRLLVAYPGFGFRQGTVGHIAEDGAVTVDGQRIAARWVFDGVTREAAGTPVDARLAFTGWEVRCARPVFDPTVPVLFDFRTDQGDGARFVYVRPDDPYRALVELTAFVPRHASPPPSASRSAALAAYLPGKFEVLRTESAVLPLRTKVIRHVRGRVVGIGAAAGLVKASTGYAYTRIQRHSAAIARSLARYGDPYHLGPVRRRYRLLDAVLLDVFDRDPASLERAFGRLFAALPAPRVLRFLDEDARAGDIVRVMAALPPLPYLAALARRAGGPPLTGRMTLSHNGLRDDP